MGANGSGQLGDGTQTQRNSAVAITLPGGVAATAVAAGGGHSLAIGANGKLYAWGNDASGQIGTGASTYSAYLSPILVSSLPASITVSAVAGGGDHSLAIGSDGKLYAWGSNAAGQLGDNSALTRRDTAGIVSLPAGVSPTAVAAGVNHSLAIGSDGQLYAWGSNSAGQLGDGTQTQRNTPVIVSLPAGVSPIAVSAGGDHSQAIGSDGKLYAWGINTVGQLGDGSATQRLTPVIVSLPAGVAPTAIATGYSHSMATGSDGKLYAWGFGGNGQVGDGAATSTHTVPVPVVLPVGVSPSSNIAAGANHSLALGSDNRLYAWGYDASGQLGDNATTQRLLPLAVSAPTSPAPADKLAAGDGHSLQIRNGKLYAWGLNGNGQLGDSTTTSRSAPIAVGLAAGVTPATLAAGADHSLAIGSEGRLYSWGWNGNGQLGDGSTTNRAAPVAITLPASAKPTVLAGGYYHSLAIGSNGQLYAWGYNGNGQLGDGSATQHNTPVAVNLPVGVTPTSVTAGAEHSLAIGSDGKLYAWGWNVYGQLGNGSLSGSNTPVAANLPTGVTPTALAAGYHHSLAIGSNGKLYAWGYNMYGQLGDGSTTNRNQPIAVSLPTGVTPIIVAAGWYHSLAIGSDDKLYAWGKNADGQLGDGTTTDRSTAVAVSLPAGVTPTSVAAGWHHSLATGSDGKVYAWGGNSSGELGNGSFGNSLVPIMVGPYPAASNDNFADRYALTGASGQTTGNNTSATTEAGEPAHWANTGGRSVWWKWTAPVSGTVMFDTEGSSFDTIMAVYSGSAVNTLTTLARNDDHNGIASSRVWVTVQAGVEYQIVVDGYNPTQAGSIVLNWRMGQTQTIYPAYVADQPLAASPIAVAMSATSGLPVDLVSNGDSVCTGGGIAITLVATGTCYLTATQPGDATYLPAESVLIRFNVVSLASQTISFPTIPNQTLGTAPINISATASSGLAVTFESLSTSVCTVSGNSVTLLAAGTCTIAAHQAGNTQYAAAPDVVQGFTITASSGGGDAGSSDSDAPLPAWALLMLSGLLAGSLRWRQRTQH